MKPTQRLRGAVAAAQTSSAMRLVSVLLLLSCAKGPDQAHQRQALDGEVHRLLTLELTAPGRLEVLDDRVVPLPLPTFRGEPEWPWRLEFTADGEPTTVFFSQAQDELRGEFPKDDGQLEGHRLTLEKPVFPARVPARGGVLTLFVRARRDWSERARLVLGPPR